MNYNYPFKQLVKESENYLHFMNSKEYQIYQEKFDSLYLQIKNNLNTLQMIIKEIQASKSKFIRKKHIYKKVCSLDNNIDTMNYEIENIQESILNYNFNSISY